MQCSQPVEPRPNVDIATIRRAASNALRLSRIFSPSLTTTSSFPPGGGMNFRLSSLFGVAWLLPLVGWYDFKYGMMFWLARLGRFLTPPCRFSGHELRRQFPPRSWLLSLLTFCLPVPTYWPRFCSHIFSRFNTFLAPDFYTNIHNWLLFILHP